jgi:hypothetical protein
VAILGAWSCAFRRGIAAAPQKTYFIRSLNCRQIGSRHLQPHLNQDNRRYLTTVNY